MIAYFNYINSIQFNVDQFNRWKESQNDLHNLIINNNYKEVVQA